MNPQTGLMSDQTSEPQHTGNWFTHLLPTIGSLGGGAGGAAIGTALLPGLGTIAGGILGAAFGGGGAKAAENYAEGNNISNGVESNAIEGGIGQAVGGIGAKVLGKGAELLAGRANGITSTAKAATDVASEDAAKMAEANAIKNNYGGIKPGVQTSNNLGGNQNLLQSFGLDHTDPQVMANASKGGLFLNDIDEAALKGGSPIKTTDLISSKDITTASPEEQTALVNAGIITPEGTLPTTVSPIQANKFAQDLNGQMRTVQGLSDNAFKNGDFTNYNAANQQLADLTGRYKNVQQLAATPEVNASIAARTVSPEEKAQLVEQYGQKQADSLENAVNDAQTHQDLVTAKLPYAQMNTLSKQALGDLNAPATARGVARAKMDTNGDNVADTTLPSTITPNLASDIHNAGGVTGKALALVKHGANSPLILNTLSRMGALTAKVAPSAGIIAGTSNNALQQDNGTVGGTMQPTNSVTGGLPMPQQAPNQGLSREDLLTLAMYSPGALAAIAPSAQQTQNVTSANTAQSALSGLGNAPEGGLLSQLQAKLGIGATGEYQRKAAAAAQQIAAAVPGSNAGAIEKQLTDYVAGGGNIDEAIKALQQNLSGVIQSNQNTGLSGILGVGAGSPQNITSQLAYQ